MKTYFKISINSILALLLCSTMSAQLSFPKVEGWECDEIPEVYNKDNLWEHINGAADYYLKYQFNKLEITEYLNSNNDYITVEVYHHNSPLFAFGIYAYERPTETNFINIGSEGYIEETSLNLCSGKYYIKFLGHSKEESIIKTMQLIADSLINLNSLPTDPVEINEKFPVENKIPHSAKYYPTNFLGHSFMHSVFEVSYVLENKSFKLFNISCSDSDKPKEILKSYFEFAKSKFPIKEERIYIIDDFFNGTVYLSIKDNYVFGAYNHINKESAHKYLSKLMEAF